MHPSGSELSAIDNSRTRKHTHQYLDLLSALEAVMTCARFFAFHTLKAGECAPSSRPPALITLRPLIKYDG